MLTAAEAGQRIVLRDFLNERRWRFDDLASLSLIVRHRGASKDEREVPGARIIEVQPAGVLAHADLVLDYGPEIMTDGTVFISYHRVLRVERGGEIAWQR